MPDGITAVNRSSLHRPDPSADCSEVTFTCLQALSFTGRQLSVPWRQATFPRHRVNIYEYWYNSTRFFVSCQLPIRGWRCQIVAEFPRHQFM